MVSNMKMGLQKLLFKPSDRLVRPADVMIKRVPVQRVWQ